MFVTAALIVSAAQGVRGQCCGDCNGNGKVLVNELVTAVTNALNDCQLTGPRFVDNGDGTVTDHETGLIWEKKDNFGGGLNLADPHDADNGYAWSASGTVADGAAYTDFLAKLNDGASTDGGASTAITGCFVGHCDWRLPTIVSCKGSWMPRRATAAVEAARASTQRSGPHTPTTTGRLLPTPAARPGRGSWTSPVASWTASVSPAPTTFVPSAGRLVIAPS